MDAAATPDTNSARLTELQRAVQHKLGGCLLRLQQYELLLKAMVAHTDLAGDPTQWQTVRDGQVSSVQKTTLGGLVSLLTGSYLHPEEEPTSGKDTADEATSNVLWFRFQLRKVMSSERHEATKAELKELVDLRNELVHHLLERFDLTQLDCCETAVIYLDASRATIDRHHQTLLRWAEQMDNVRAMAASFMSSDTFKDFLFDGIAPGGEVDWPYSGIVYSLREAEQALAPASGEGAWVELKAAIAWTAKHHPNQTPKRYGCNSWRQVLHESQEFEVMKQVPAPTLGTSPTSGTVIWYRSRREEG